MNVVVFRRVDLVFLMMRINFVFPLVKYREDRGSRRSETFQGIDSDRPLLVMEPVGGVVVIDNCIDCVIDAIDHFACSGASAFLRRTIARQLL